MDEKLESIVEGEDGDQDPFPLHTVVIQRGDRGYGLTVSGESPVIVQDVKEGGPAALAGVKKGDSIIRVNGNLVSQVNHKEVVEIIKSTQYVKLTLKSTDEEVGGLASPQDPTHRPLPPTPSSRSNERITAPLPVNTQLQSQMEMNKGKMLTMFLEKQRRVRDNIMLELQRGPTKVIQRNLEKELESINRQITKIQEELINMRDIEAQSASSVSEPGMRPLSHNRAKSSPDPLGLQSISASRLGGSDSVSEINLVSSGRSKSIYGDELTHGEPPGTPPPPYAVNSTPHPEDLDENYSIIADDISSPSMTGLLPTQPILSMEEEDFSDTEMLEDHGPFQSLSKLWNHNAYLAVFMNYVISNCDSSSLFFYVITHLYKEGVGKEMKRWAYEITSSFLLPGAPLRLNNVEENVLHEIDETLHHELDKEEILRKVFWKAKQRCREDLNEQLADFRNKRSAGLGSIFGPQDHVLEESIQNKAKELQIVEHLLVPCLESVSEDLKNATDQMLVTASSLATILLKYFGVRSQQAHNLIDRCPLFVSKERPLRSKIFRGSKKQVYRDHHFIQHTYYTVTYCNHCGLIIWGIAPQGYQCANCEMNIHKSCIKLVEEVCIGQLRKKDRGRDTRFSSILGKIMADDKDNRRKFSHVNAAHIEKAKKSYEEGNSDIHGLSSESDCYTGDKGVSGGGVGSGGTGGGKEQRRSDPGNVSGVLNHTNASSNAANATHNAVNACPDSANNGPDGVDEGGGADTSATPGLAATDSAPLVKSNPPKKKSSSAINRSESCKEKHAARKRTRENRKHSDPNIPTSKSGDVDAESSLISENSGSSSNSSLSPSLESRSTSLEHVSRTEAPLPAPALDNDSDVEAETDLPNWQKLVPHDQLKKLKPKERKRQDTINELFHTERTHVRVLKVLKHLFQLPMLHSGILPKEQVEQLFANLDQMLDNHITFNKAMKKRREEEPLVLRVGDLLVNMFDGESGEKFQHDAAEFVRMQGFALENLKQKQRRESSLSTFLQEQENNPLCRRLQLKDMLPAGFQRLSKYPLLLESLLAYTDSAKQREEYDQIARALERSKDIIAFVNTAVQEAENNQRLSEIQKRLDQSSLAKNKHGHSEELRGNLDLTKYKLIYEGPLTWRIARSQKNVDLHVLLLDEFIVLLQKADDKFILKNHSINKSLGKDDNKLTHSPIIKYGPSMLFRAVATDRCAFFLVTTQSVSAQIYELVTISANERKVWFRHIQEAQEAYMAQRRSQQHGTPLSPDDAATNADNLLDVEDEIEGGEAVESSNDTSDKGATPCKGGEAGAGQQDDTPAPAGASPPQAPPSPDTVAKKTEHLRRKDLRIRQALEEKQHIIADILNIPYEHFENVADMAGEAGVGNKEPKELVLAAMYQAKCLQETLNEALNVRESDIVAARANNDGALKLATLPLYQAPMTKLMSISSSLVHQLSSLLNLISERDEERERNRKELVTLRERLHRFHMQSNSLPSPSAPPTGPAPQASPAPVSPHTSRPSSFVSVGSSVADHSDTPDHHDTDEESGGEAKVNSQPEEAEDTRQDSGPEIFEDTVSDPDAVNRESGAVAETPDAKEKTEGATEDQERSKQEEEAPAEGTDETHT